MLNSASGNGSNASTACHAEEEEAVVLSGRSKALISGVSKPCAHATQPLSRSRTKLSPPVSSVTIMTGRSASSLCVSSSLSHGEASERPICIVSLCIAVGGVVKGGGGVLGGEGETNENQRGGVRQSF